MKKILFIILSLFITNTFSQKGKITYIASLESNFFEKLKNKNDVNIDLLSRNEKEAKNVDCILLFNKTKSVFKKIEKLEDESSRVPGFMNIIDFKVGGDASIFYDSKSKTTINVSDSTGETLLVVMDKIHWDITNETKIINDFNCIKATSVYKYLSSYNGYITQKVTAWFTPQIPINFGPKQYNGLPGLVISLNVGGIKYQVSKIELNSKEEISINLPKGKKITQKEFDEIPWDY